MIRVIFNELRIEKDYQFAGYNLLFRTPFSKELGHCSNKGFPFNEVITITARNT